MEKLIQEALKGQPFNKTLDEDIHKDAFPPSDLPNIKTCQLIFSIIEYCHTGVGYTNLTGWFPFRYSRCNKYIFVAYQYDTNTILAEYFETDKMK